MARARADTVAASPRDSSAMLSKHSRCPRNVAFGVTPSLRASPSAFSVAEQSLKAHSVPSSAGRPTHSAAGCAPSGLPCRAGAATAGVPTLSTLNAGPSTPRRPLRCPPPQAGGRGSGFGSGGGATSHSQGRIATEVRTPEGPIHWGCYLSRRSTLEDAIDECIAQIRRGMRNVGGSSSASTSGSSSTGNSASGTRGTSSSSSSSSSGTSSSGSSGSGRGNWTERLTAPLRLGLKDLAPTLLNLAGAVTVTKVGQQAAQQLASNLVCSHLKYQAALRAATGLGGLSVKGAVAGWGKQAVLEAAQRSLTAATARYAALRGALSLLGPLMWGWLALDLALKAIGPDYARVVRAVFLLSQVRLVRTHGFVSGEMAAAAAAAASTYESDFGLEEEDDYYDPGAAVPWL